MNKLKSILVMFVVMIALAGFAVTPTPALAPAPTSIGVLMGDRGSPKRVVNANTITASTYAWRSQAGLFDTSNKRNRAERNFIRHIKPGERTS